MNEELDSVPTLDVSVKRGVSTSYSFERSDIDGAYFSLPDSTALLTCSAGLLRLLSDLENFSRSCNDTVSLKSVRESKTGLEKLVSKMDSFESRFDKIAERSRAYNMRFLKSGAFSIH